MIASFIDHTALKPTATAALINQLCEEALAHRFAAVCVPPAYVAQAAGKLKNTAVAVATVVGFPLGYNTTAVKVFEARNALQDGATEIDVVQHLGWVKEGNQNALRQEAAALMQTVGAAGGLLKIILETALLTQEEIIACCQLYGALGVPYVKTSTGFAEGNGATREIVALMRDSLPAGTGIKAAGGIRTFAQASALLAAGATRLGTSAGAALVAEENNLL